MPSRKRLAAVAGVLGGPGTARIQSDMSCARIASQTRVVAIARQQYRSARQCREEEPQVSSIGREGRSARRNGPSFSPPRLNE